MYAYFMHQSDLFVASMYAYCMHQSDIFATCIYAYLTLLGKRVLAHTLIWHICDMYLCLLNSAGIESVYTYTNLIYLRHIYAY